MVFFLLNQRIYFHRFFFSSQNAHISLPREITRHILFLGVHRLWLSDLSKANKHLIRKRVHLHIFIFIAMPLEYSKFENFRYECTSDLHANSNT